jgi:hypothetical protein
LLSSSGFRTFIIELATTQSELLDAFETCATDHGGAAENWGTSTKILCAKCSRGTPHEHAPRDSPAYPHLGLAARDHAHAEAIISEWLVNAPGADVTAWYEAPLPDDRCN